MAEAQAATKSKTEYTDVALSDGRTVKFAGKRKVNKETLLDESKIQVDGDVIQLEKGAVKLRFDFRSGDTRTVDLPLAMLAKYAGHGGEQKFGDEFASPADKPMSEEDMVLAFDALYDLHCAGKWGVGRAEGGGGVSGAGIVVRAILEDLNSRRGGETGKALLDIQFVKDFLQKKLDGDANLTRRALYDSFRANPAINAIIKRMESEKEPKAPVVDTTAAMAEMEGA